MGGTTLCNQACFLASVALSTPPIVLHLTFVRTFSSYLSFSRRFSNRQKSLYINHKVSTDRISLSYPYSFFFFFSHQFFSLSHSKGVAGSHIVQHYTLTESPAPFHQSTSDLSISLVTSDATRSQGRRGIS